MLRLFIVVLLFALSQATCANPGVPCRVDAECPKGQHCGASQCRQDCSAAKPCAVGTCNERGRCQQQSCVPLHSKRCFGQELHWINSCGSKEELIKVCGPVGCSSGKCNEVSDACGDGTCDPTGHGETCGNCPTDCGCQVPNTCQQGQCKPPLSSCGDGSCDGPKGENCASCVQDCACPSGLSCQNELCQAPPVDCGNGTCEAQKGENCGTCAKDCSCPAGKLCQNNTCQDPPSDCGNGTCEAQKGEHCGSCAKDCPCASGQSCQNGACRDPNAWPTAPPSLHPKDPHRLAIAGKTWVPVGYYPGAGMNMTGLDYKGDVYLYWKTFVDKLAAAKLNFMRLWLNWGAVPSTGAKDNWDRHVMTPYVLNAAGKVDLTKFNPDYFKLLKTFVDYSRAKGIVIQMMVLDCWHIGPYGADHGVLARDYYKKANNINGVDFASGAEWLDPKSKIFPHHKRFVEEVVKSVGDRPNIIWETCNELILRRGDSHYKTWQGSKTQAFHVAIADVIRKQEKASGFRPHLIMPVDLPEHRTVGGHGDISAAANQEAHRSLASQYAWNIPLISDNDCFCKSGTASERRQRGWAVLTAGAHIDLFDNKAYQKSVLTGKTLDDALRFLGHIRTFLEQSKIDLAGMRPSDSLVSNGAWALAAPGSRFIVYLPQGGSTTVQQLPASRQARWFNPRSGAFAGDAGKGPNFKAPDGSDWVLLIESGGGPPSPCGDGTCDAAKGENCQSCAADCSCPSGQSCQNNACKASACIQNTIADFEITSKAPTNSTKLPMKDGVIYKSLKVEFEFNPVRWQPDCYNPVHSPPRLMSPFQVLVSIRKGLPFCRGGSVFGVNLRGGRNSDIWADTYHKDTVTSQCGGSHQHLLLPKRPRHGLKTGQFHKVSVYYNPSAKDFTFNLAGAIHKGTPYPQAVLKSTASAPLYLRFSLERWLECFDSSGAKVGHPNAPCCHLPSVGWKYRKISYELCP